MSGSQWYSFSSNQLGRAQNVNANFDWNEGHLTPQLDGTEVNNTYDLGESSYQWRTGYFAGFFELGSQTMSGVDNVTLEMTGGAIAIKNGGIRGATANTGGSQREIQTGGISRADLRAESLISHTQSTAASGTGGTTATSVNITTAIGTVLLMGDLNLSVSTPNTTAGYAVQFDLYITRGGVAITGSKQRFRFLHYYLPNKAMSVCVRCACIDTIGSSGSPTYDLIYSMTSGVVNSVRFAHISAVELRV